ncbi:MAG TPA: YihY/virulence factor BrkB family protein [Thermomicrobiales bacterium]|nr:YihY/virulence factor BrkB family protein [Thermomicrobiales bacterium]
MAVPKSIESRTPASAPASGSRLRQATAAQWREVVLQSGRDLLTSSAVEWAAAIAFYAMLSLFPLMILRMVLASFVTDADWAAQEATRLLGEFIPRGQEEIEAIVSRAISDRRRVGILSLVVLVATGRRILGVVTKALNHVSDVDAGSDSWLRRSLVELSLACGLIVLGLLALAARPLTQLAWETSRVLPGADGPSLVIIQFLVRVVILVVLFGLVYAVVPRGDRRWPAVITGAVVATVLFLIAQGAFALLIDRILESLRLIYGPFAFAALLLSWAWYVALITLVGGALASHVKVMILEDDDAPDASRQHVEHRDG